MATKHDGLTEEEVVSCVLNPTVTRQIGLLVESAKQRLPGRGLNILDGGYGRGRSVAKLRELGFNAFGVDIDEMVMRNGYALFEKRGTIRIRFCDMPTIRRCLRTLSSR